MIDFGCIVFYTTNLRVSKAARNVILHNMHSFYFQMKIAVLQVDRFWNGKNKDLKFFKHYYVDKLVKSLPNASLKTLHILIHTVTCGLERCNVYLACGELGALDRGISDIGNLTKTGFFPAMLQWTFQWNIHVRNKISQKFRKLFLPKVFSCHIFTYGNISGLSSTKDRKSNREVVVTYVKYAF